MSQVYSDTLVLSLLRAMNLSVKLENIHAVRKRLL